MIKELEQTAQTNILVRVFCVRISCADEIFSWHDPYKISSYLLPYSRFSLSRSLKYFELSVPQHISFAELRKK